jgi:L-lactate dehydrogenase (cytochrome)
MTIDRAINIADLRKRAERRLPRMVFDYIDGGADDELAMRANEDRLAATRLLWNALVEIDQIDLTARVLGADMKLPFFIAPTAAARMFHTAGERAGARAAEAFGIAYSLSTIASTTIEDVAATSSGTKFFQIYVWKDRGLVRAVLERAKAAGFTAAILTVDVPVAGNRERDLRHGFSIPPRVNLTSTTQTLARPAWLWDLMRGPRIEPANFRHIAASAPDGIIGFINSQFDRTVTWKDAEAFVQDWGGPFAIKGIATPADARRCRDVGATAVWVSNHGGRQLGASPATIDLLEPIVEAVRQDLEIIFDGGIRRGEDIVKALALGANACAIGRPWLWGLAAAGEPGVRRALSILEDELRRTMALVGCRSITELGPDLFHRGPLR